MSGCRLRVARCLPDLPADSDAMQRSELLTSSLTIKNMQLGRGATERGRSRGTLSNTERLLRLYSGAKDVEVQACFWIGSDLERLGNSRVIVVGSVSWQAPESPRSASKSVRASAFA